MGTCCQQINNAQVLTTSFQQNISEHIDKRNKVYNNYQSEQPHSISTILNALTLERRRGQK